MPPSKPCHFPGALVAFRYHGAFDICSSRQCKSDRRRLTLPFRSYSPFQKPEASSNTTCEHCGATVKRPTDLPRHMLIHAPNKEELSVAFLDSFTRDSYP
jgi:hypothetical protein